MSSSLAIELDGLSKNYYEYDSAFSRLLDSFWGKRRYHVAQKSALKDINFSIVKGETIGVIGSNGSGKSTLLQIICGTLEPTEGVCRVNGKIAALLELGAGFNPEFSGRENVYLTGALYGLSRKEITDRLPDIEAFAEIGAAINQPVRTYSSGMYVRLAFSIIAHVQADILVIDEALAVGDALFTQKCMRFLRGFKKHGTLFFVSHDTSAVLALCDKAIWIEQGHLRSFDETKLVCESYLEYLHLDAESSIESLGGELDVGSENYKIQHAHERDMRAEWINLTPLRNDIQVFSFKGDGGAFGQGAFEITDLTLSNVKNERLTWIVGGEIVILTLKGVVKKEIRSPILGFVVRNSHGVSLFGDNTYLTYKDDPMSANRGDTLSASFKFRMPILPGGDYVVSVAVANGTQRDHVQEHWIHDALVFSSHSTSVATGLMGIPMLDINISK